MAALLATSCTAVPATELVVRVDSTLPWGPAQTIQSVVLEIRREGPSGPLRSLRTTVVGPAAEQRALPFTVGVLPDAATNDTTTPVWLRLLGCSSPLGCTSADAVARVEATERFVVDARRDVALVLGGGVDGGVDGGADAGTDAARDVGGEDRQVVDAPDIAVLADAGDAGDTPAMDVVDVVDAVLGDDGDVPAMDAGDVLIADVGDAPAADRRDAGDAPSPDAGDATDSGPGVCVPSTCPAPLNARGTCVGGVCGFECVTGFGDCTIADGCETNVHASAANCGRCGGVCGSGQVCRAGACVAVSCPTGMRLIPGGGFEMGSDEALFTMPVRHVDLTAFCLDETEVTVAAYRSCVTAGSCSAPIMDTSSCTVAYSNWLRSARETHPINCVTWVQAEAFCASRSAALPTAAQWEYAARGTDGRRYPWGNADPMTSDAPPRLCWNRSASTGTCGAGSIAGDTSAFGILDLGGNLQELVDLGIGDRHERRGGSWGITPAFPDSLLSAAHNGELAGDRADYGTGFRCARAP